MSPEVEVGFPPVSPSNRGGQNGDPGFQEPSAGSVGSQEQSPPAHTGFCPQGLGTKEGVIIEILASRTKNQLREIMKAYEEGTGAARMGRAGTGKWPKFGEEGSGNSQGN